MAETTQETDKNSAVSKMKKLKKFVEEARGYDETSMISIILPSDDGITIPNPVTMLEEKYETAASNTESNVYSKSSQLDAIASALKRLKRYDFVPYRNGLVLYAGIIATEDGKESNLVTIEFEPFWYVSNNWNALYWCDSKFHAEALNEKIGFIVMDDNSSLIGTWCCTNSSEVLHKFSVNIPKEKNFQKGQSWESILRYSPSKIEKRRELMTKTTDLLTRFFINPATGKVENISGLVLVGSGFGTMFVKRLIRYNSELYWKILREIKVSCGGEIGFNEAIEHHLNFSLSSIKSTSKSRT